MWLVKISPPTGSPGGSTTLVGNGRTREVIGQTTARPVFSVNEAADRTRAGGTVGNFVRRLGMIGAKEPDDAATQRASYP
jgi:hypothetical protein